MASLENISGEMMGVAALAIMLLVPVIYIVMRSRRQHRAMELYHAERMATIERGMEPPPFMPELAGMATSARNAARSALLPGLVWFFVGLAILGSSSIAAEREFSAVGLVPVGIGLAYLVYYFFEERKSKHRARSE